MAGFGRSAMAEEKVYLIRLDTMVNWDLEWRSG